MALRISRRSRRSRYSFERITVNLNTGKAAVDRTNRTLEAMSNSRSVIPRSEFFPRILLMRIISSRTQAKIWLGNSISEGLLMKCEGLVSRSQMYGFHILVDSVAAIVLGLRVRTQT